MKVLEVEKISKTFAALKAVDQVSFEIEEGVSFGLLGPNGAGKTTTIRMITNIIIPDSGRVSVMGNGDLKTAANYLGYLPEERGMYRKMKVGEYNPATGSKSYWDFNLFIWVKIVFLTNPGYIRLL